MFSEDLNQPVTNFVSGDFKKDFGMPIYDEYEDEFLDLIPTKPTMESRSISKEKLIVIQSQKTKKIEDNEYDEGENLPLCYSSFELIRQRLKASKQKQKFEDMENLMNFLEVEDDEDEQSCSQSHLMEKSVVFNEALDHK